MYILGISAFYHDSAACLIHNGEIIAAAQEERFTRKKHDPSYPEQAIKYCLSEAGISKNNISYVAFYDKPLLKFERILKTYISYAPRGFKTFKDAMSLWGGNKLFIKQYIQSEFNSEVKVLFPEHHESHGMSAFYPSPFQDAAVLTIDGVGEWATTSLAAGKGNSLDILSQIHFPHSLGLLYSAFTSYTGFKVNSGEYKIMGLAPYGEAKYKHLIYDNLIDVKDDGSFHLNMDYFNYPVQDTMTNHLFHSLFGGEPRAAEAVLSQREMDLASSVQVVTEEIVTKLAMHARKETGLNNLCLAGGVALNCVSNGRLVKEEIFENIWIQPASGDAGGAIGAALGVWHQYLQKDRIVDGVNDKMNGSYLGIGFSDAEIQQYLNQSKIPYEEIETVELGNKIADLLNQENVIGWFQGRMEFGPRSLGNRSIIGDPRSEKMQEKMNLKIKFRESFRPFAPSVIEEKASEWFDLNVRSPYMLLVAPVKEDKQQQMSEEEQLLFGIDKLNISRSEIPAVTHVDYSARVQTVNKEENPRYHQLISAFDEKYGCPVIVNTSFNVRGEPPVCTPQDAYRCFMRTHMDYLVLGRYLVKKSNQPEQNEDNEWMREFELD